MGQHKLNLAMNWRSGSFQLKIVANKKVKNNLGVEINQFGDVWRDTMRSSYAIDKIWGVTPPTSWNLGVV